MPDSATLQRGRFDYPPTIDDPTAGLDLRSPSRFLLSLMRTMGWVVPAMTLAAASWMVPAALTPWLLGRAIDAGVVRSSPWATVGWVAVLLGVIAFGVVGGIGFHTMAVREWLLSIYGTQKRVGRKAVALGHVLNRRIPTGEVLSVSASDSDQFGATIDAFGGMIAALVSFSLVTVLMLTTSPSLGLVVLVATPILLLASTPLLRPLNRAQEAERTENSTLTSMATDIVSGLRILRGVGGERTFAENYARQSQKVRGLGVRLGTWQASIEAVSVLLSGLLLTALVYLGAHQMIDGRLSIGQLISFFGYAVFLLSPMQAFFDFAQKWVQGLVAAGKSIALFSSAEPWDRRDRLVGEQPEIHDVISDVTVQPGRMLAIVSADPDESAALADRLGRYLADEPAVEMPDLDELKGKALRRARADVAEARAAKARADAERAAQPWGVAADGVDYSQLDLASLRERVVVSDTASTLFAGTLQEAVDPWGRHTRTDAERALVTASAEDIYDGLAGGWQGLIEEKGRGLSGGQRQRLVLARVLLLDPDVLILVEPTSAVDAHTEARIAARLAEHRRGRTTVVVTASPLLLREADDVVLLSDGRQAARGTHDSLHDNPHYRRVISRGMENEND